MAEDRTHSGGDDRSRIETFYRVLQDKFTSELQEVADGAFDSDVWERPGGGGGETRVMEGRGAIEKAAVNFSAVWGAPPPQLSERLRSEEAEFYATGISVIVHPRNPHAPTFHANLRYFETDDGDAWFGGGADLTPVYLYEEDARSFHAGLKEVCDRHPIADYEAWKRACDEYFYLPHRGEARGVGGIFYDHLTDRLDEVAAFQRDLGESLPSTYLAILRQRMSTDYDEAAREWQELRRGRYAEFNLVWDRGTRFGLETSGRVESILASLPPKARWAYGHEPAAGSAEAALLDLVKGAPRNWA